MKYHCYPEGGDHDSEYREVVADTAQEAAEKFRDIDDRESVEWPSESNVVVRECRSGSETVFTVSCEAVPVYRAKPKKEPRP